MAGVSGLHHVCTRKQSAAPIALHWPGLVCGACIGASRVELVVTVRFVVFLIVR